VLYILGRGDLLACFHIKEGEGWVRGEGGGGSAVWHVCACAWE
jgi:hypothetical protein